MSEWQQLSLGSLMEIIGGGTPKTSVSGYWGGDIPWLSVVDFNTGLKFVSSTEKTITQEGLNNSSTKLLNKGDIIISARGTVGVLAILDKPMTFNQSCYGIRSKKGISDTDYLYYLLTDTVRELTQISHGGVFDTITRATFDEIEVAVPPLPEQKAIASVLSSLDDKIDLLHRQNKTLEAMAETLFRQWFIEEAKEDWRETKVLDVFSLVGGGTPKTSEADYWDGDIPWLSGGDIANAHQGFIVRAEKAITELGLEKSSTKLLPKLASVISARGTVGRYAMLSRPMTFSQSNYGIIPKGHVYYYFVYLLLAYIVDELSAAAYGSVFDTITTRTFEDVEIKLPSMDFIAQFESEIAPLFEKKLNNVEQIQTLENLRDTLLPKLMSGEVRVQYQTEEVA
ncbi:hypothetical protein F908_00169 [Acinetobacter sp. NIPH 284]|uniref:restriction endonuclease subunit S n=1 Tax=Acinetobacter sp. NIPH 284 TaxID=1217704 RepID=UPI0002D13F8F|nr:restriction endonuclease subunit S [Acinetobacter sp. NIPH 284]ENW85075.1 hypothetical protein F908_00169 [Acinetobacter sp. NIPH 284]